MNALLCFSRSADMQCDATDATGRGDGGCFHGDGHA